MNKLLTFAALSLLFSLVACSKKEEMSEETPMSEIKLTAEQKTEWSVYRQELRDVTSQSDPKNIIWPSKPL